MHQQDDKTVNANSKVRHLEEALHEFLAYGYPPEVIAELMLAQATSLFAGLGQADCRQIVSHVLERTATIGTSRCDLPQEEHTRAVANGNVIAFPVAKAQVRYRS